ncbi:helix-turn-helix transcriptional regulator [Streptomyces sp. NA02950]|uniref:helix-turn-helix transcriptional regulator n=1 Tax=Streptomyces sp. NA02950 TaxID=2742137 RepID=UPI0015914A18|nr:helix-turn-helix transcriptional regulator [Streptomyces sp. NA02950]QKV96293.1 helix-turn-helix transcriptional regulator [Streptomyces sp. NA02950]
MSSCLDHESAALARLPLDFSRLLHDPAQATAPRHAVSHLADRPSMSRPQVSRHLRTPRDLDLVSTERNGRFVHYGLDLAAVERIGRDVATALRY